MPSKQGRHGSYGEPLTPDDIRELRVWLSARRPTDAPPCEIILEGETPADDPAAAAAKVQPLAEAGAAWWIEGLWDAMQDPDRVRRRILAGPPREVDRTSRAGPG
jgi:hypothetical protein